MYFLKFHVNKTNLEETIYDRPLKNSSDYEQIFKSVYKNTANSLIQFILQGTVSSYTFKYNTD